MDINSFLIILITLVTAVLVAVGIYLIIVLKEARQTLIQLNKNLSRTESILTVVDEKMAQPAGSLVGVLSVVREVVGIFSNFKNKGAKDQNGK